MKYLALALLLAVAVSGFSQVVLYEDSAELSWDPITVDANGDPLLPGDTVTYDVYYYDLAAPPTDVQDIAQLQYAGSTTATSYTVLFPTRREWAIGVRGTITDGGGTSGGTSRVAWSLIAGDVDIAAMGGPFYYTPLVPQGSQPPPQSLLDTRY